MEMDSGISEDYLPMDPKRLLERLHTALNTRDLTNLLKCLQVDYEQIFPDGSSKDTTGLEAARQMWESLFTTYPDFRADLLRQAIDGSTIWTEWRLTGGLDGAFRQAGVMIMGVEEGLIAWNRIYLRDEARQ